MYGKLGESSSVLSLNGMRTVASNVFNSKSYNEFVKEQHKLW